MSIAPDLVDLSKYDCNAIAEVLKVKFTYLVTSSVIL